MIKLIRPRLFYHENFKFTCRFIASYTVYVYPRHSSSGALQYFLSGASDASDAVVHSDVSEIVEPLLILDTEPISLTYYVRDAPGREPIYGDISYTWQFQGTQDGSY